jgi:hypothetical protein
MLDLLKLRDERFNFTELAKELGCRVKISINR